MKKNILFLFLIFASSCAKEIYTNEDAERSKLASQKTGLTVIIRDIGSYSADLSGFTVSSPRYGETVEAVTSAEGIASLMIVKGDAVIHVTKEGYVPAMAIVTANSVEKELGNTVTVVPVFARVQESGILRGTVSVKRSASTEPLTGAVLSIGMDMNELMRRAFPGTGDSMERYRPGALTYLSENIMQPVCTDDAGAFQFTIPATAANLVYTVNVHETELTQNTLCNVITNGQDNMAVLLKLTPYER